MIELLGQGLALTRHCKLGRRKNPVHATSFLLNTNNLVPQRDISATVTVKHFKGLAVKVLFPVCFYLVLQGCICSKCLTSASASCIFYKYFRFVMACCDDWWPSHRCVHLSKTIGAGVVDQVERLDGGAVVQPVASVWQRGEGELTSSDEAFFVPSSLYNL